MSAKNTQAAARRRWHAFFCWSQRALFAAGLVLLGYVALAVLQAKLYEMRARQYLDGAATKQAGRQQAGRPEAASVVPVPLEGAILGRLEIARLGVSVVVLQGTKPRTLRLGVGHIEGTVLPGEPGNSAIAGHRDTFFRALKEIRPDDEIQLQTATGLSRYRVDWAKIVSPSDVAVLKPSSESLLTLVTCYPFYFFGAAPDRFVIRAHLSRLPIARE
jgi:sortase A